MEVRYQLRYSPANAKRQHSAEERAPVTGTEADRGRINTYPPESGGNGVNFPECGKKC